MSKIEEIISRLADRIVDEIPDFLTGVAILLIGSWLIKFTIRVVRGRFESRNVDLSLRDFLISILRFGLYTLLIVTAAARIGIHTSSFVTILGACGLAIGLALQGSLSNFAGGMLILLFRPIRVGDTVSSSANASGTVQKIDILYTTLLAADGSRVFVPNGALANSVITNFTEISRRKVEYQINLSSDNSIQKIRDVVINVLKEDGLVKDTPKAEVKLSAITENGVVVVISYWVDVANYGDAFPRNFERIKDAFDTNGIAYPPPAPKR